MPNPPRSRPLDVSLDDADLAEALELAYRRARRNGASHADADDIAQDSVLTAMENVADGKIDDRAFIPWTGGIASKRVITTARSEGRRSARQSRYSTERERTCGEVDETEYVLGWEWVKAAMAQLTARQRDVMRLVMQGWSTEEIALTLGVKEGTVRTHLADARCALTALVHGSPPVE